MAKFEIDVFDSWEERANRYGFTLNGESEHFDKLSFAAELLFVYEYITENQYDAILSKIIANIGFAKKPLGSEE